MNLPSDPGHKQLHLSARALARVMRVVRTTWKLWTDKCPFRTNHAPVRKKTRYSDEQIVRILREADQMPVAKAAKKLERTRYHKISIAPSVTLPKDGN